jgi:hypothetical protein
MLTKIEFMSKNALILQIFLILSSLFCFAQKTIKGEVILFNPEDKELVAGKKLIYLRDTFNEIAFDSVYIDENLRFEFKNVDRDSVNIFFKPRNYPGNASYNVKLIGRDKKWEKLKIDYSPTCPYSKTNKICPKCHISNDVIPIVYGYVIQRKDQKDKIKLGGCVTFGCEPNWYCKKDDLDF